MRDGQLDDLSDHNPPSGPLDCVKILLRCASNLFELLKGVEMIRCCLVRRLGAFLDTSQLYSLVRLRLDSVQLLSIGMLSGEQAVNLTQQRFTASYPAYNSQCNKSSV